MEQVFFAPAEGRVKPVKELYKIAPLEFIEAWYSFLEREGQIPLVELIDQVVNEDDFSEAEHVAVMIGISFMDWPNVPRLDQASLGRPMGAVKRTLFTDYLGLRNMVEFEIRITMFLNYDQASRARVRNLLARIFRAAERLN